MAFWGFPHPAALLFAAAAVASGRAAFNRFPLLEGLDLDEDIIGLEPLSWEELSRDLRAWVIEEEEGMKQQKTTTCRSCTRLARAEARGTTSLRELDDLIIDTSPFFDPANTRTNGAQDPFRLHPEGPSLERREALAALA